jgi:hypothetical protein
METISVRHEDEAVCFGDRVEETVSSTSNAFDMQATVVVDLAYAVNEVELSVAMTRQRTVQHHRERGPFNVTVAGEEAKCGSHKEFEANEVDIGLPARPKKGVPVDSA